MESSYLVTEFINIDSKVRFNRDKGDVFLFALLSRGEPPTSRALQKYHQSHYIPRESYTLT